jgi:hypothetical protein
MPVMIGVDPHKASHTAAALDEHGQLLGHQRVPATLDGYQQLRQWAGRWPQRCWAVEGAHGRKSDPDGAVSVAVTARSVPQLRQVGVEARRRCCTC